MSNKVGRKVYCVRIKRLPDGSLGAETRSIKYSNADRIDLAEADIEGIYGQSYVSFEDAKRIALSMMEYFS